MFRPHPLRLVSPAVLLLPAIILAGCGDGDTGPGQSSLVVAATATASGNGQEGTVGDLLEDPLRVIVTRDGDPVADVAVQWSADNDGLMVDEESLTDDEGIAQSGWILGPDEGEQTARATVSNAQGSPVEFTATATPVPPPSGTTVQLQDAAFAPASVTVSLGQTVTWVWPAGSLQHNIVPDDNSTPSGSGPPRAGPDQYAFTFTLAGVYHYHCVVHGGPGGQGMSGTVTVLNQLP